VLLGGSDDDRNDAIILCEVGSSGIPPRKTYLELPSYPEIQGKPKFEVEAEWTHPPLNRPSPSRILFDSSDAQIIEITVHAVNEGGRKLAAFNLLVSMSVIRRYAQHTHHSNHATAEYSME
jgi:hypothetical protein